MDYPTKGIPWTTLATAQPLKDLELIKLLGRKQIMKNNGLYDKYTISVTHKDGKEVDPNKEFLVIELTNPDPREFEAALQFARICIMTGYRKLGEDIIRKLYKGHKSEWYVESELIIDFGPYPKDIAEKLESELDKETRFAYAYSEGFEFNVEQFIKDI